LEQSATQMFDKVRDQKIACL